MNTRIRPWHRAAFSLIELLVVIAIITILMGLLLVSIQRVRESANRMRCSSNLRSLGLASYQFHDIHKHFPPIQGWVGEPERTKSAVGNLFFHLLPYLSHEDLFHGSFGPIRPSGPVPDRPVYCPINNRIEWLPVAALVCPSNPSFAQSPTQFKYYTYGVSCYGYNALVFAKLDGPFKDDDRPAENTTVIKQYFPRTRATLTDGPSQTILFVEKYPRCSYLVESAPGDWRPWEGGSAWADMKMICYATAASASLEFATFAPAMQLTYYRNEAEAVTGFIDDDPRIYRTSIGLRWGQTVIGPYSKFQVCPKWDGGCDPFRAATPHANGMPTCMADGSVRVLAEHMSNATWWALCTPASIDVPGGDW